MNLIKQYKTISILVVLIIIFGALAVFVKVFDIGGIKNVSSITVVLTPTPTPASDPFIRPESLNIPSSYMGYLITKTTQTGLGDYVIKYGTKSVTLKGTEWVISKSNVSTVEYGQVKNLVQGYIQGQLVNKGWGSKVKVNGQTLTPNVLGIGDLNAGYVKVSNGKFQEAILEGGRSSNNVVNIKLFLSSIYDFNSL
jgi:hypothetical protein